MKNKFIYAAVFVLSWLIFQFAFVIGVHFQSTANQTQSLASVEKRIAIDLPKLRLANPKFKTVADSRSVSRYLSDLNAALDLQSSPLYVISIQGIAAPDVIPAKAPLEAYLLTNDQKIVIQYAAKSLTFLDYFGTIPLLLALIISLLCIRKLRTSHNKAATVMDELETIASHQLIIDLKSKTLAYIDTSTAIVLPNKPFCFYAALVDFCIQDKSANLSNSSDVPDELVQTANKYFYRLIDLGHTKRKRPDFAANLDKTLSEIRSALDDIFVDYQDEKEQFYPPKAQGEGSRSKLHNYALPNIKADKVLFIGK
ncbi:hypothetical protein [Paraglaciecola polaris]|mgnify:CR=1 FL=1|uniref:Uncharacterized protein n=1 Tax=Paraglaciecola polaris LMG 21857 TaxID=1129793 RepID=K6YMR0_9ALTE|nr:hypothetical protein [Paraglaciecola polaris]GAC33974.1 hypothetical protein GPLA_3083 [Paraglaciecola polaris LMG 21857]|tara:strand:+ start:4808 stop:5743 length:936 start_codon:yes stop_codon:yes gene_type:complete